MLKTATLHTIDWWRWGERHNRCSQIH